MFKKFEGPFWYTYIQWPNVIDAINNCTAPADSPSIWGGRDKTCWQQLVSQPLEEFLPTPDIPGVFYSLDTFLESPEPENYLNSSGTIFHLPEFTMPDNTDSEILM